MSAAANAAKVAGPQTPVETLRKRIEERSAVVGVIGLGYVGLPLAVAAGDIFARAIGFDVQRERVDQLNHGYSRIQDVDESAIKALIARKRLSGTSDFTRLRECDVIVICVPTPLNDRKDPDLSYIVAAAQSIASNLRAGQAIILESTTYPGTTDELLLPAIEQKGLQLDRDFVLAFSPERVDPGNQFPMRKITKVVGGCTPLSTSVASDFYSAIFDVVHPVKNARAAETVKLLENTFRLVNIGLVNEFAVLCEQLALDTDDVIEAAATKPFGFMPFFPGPGVGGHCIPLDPLYLNWKAKQQGIVSRFIELADDVNTKMPAHIVDLVTQALNDEEQALRNAHVLVIGVAYKDNVADTRQSPAIPIIDLLRFRGALVSYHDPLVPSLDIDMHGWTEWRPRVALHVERRGLRVAAERGPGRRRYDILHSTSLSPAEIERADCVLILSKHDAIDYTKIAKHARVIVDTRNAIAADQRAAAAGRIVHL